MSDLTYDEHVVARKRHRCFLCGEDILKGERHRIHIHKDGDGFSRTRYHRECDLVTEIDKWDLMDWEMGNDEVEFRARRQELRDENKL